MDIGLILLCIVIEVTILLILGVISYINKIQRKIKASPIETINYGKNISYGIITGIIVIVLDRASTLIFQNFTNITLNLINPWELIGQLLSLFVYTFFGFALMLFLIFYLISKGLPSR